MQYKAALCREFGSDLTIEDVTCGPLNEDFVAIEIGAVSICHSDITYMDGGWGGDLPMLLGHEAAGRITATGPLVQGFEAGDRVIITLINHCGRCASCSQGYPSLCATPVPNPIQIKDQNGTPVMRGLHCGAFAQTAVVHVSQIIKIPPAMSYDIASLLGCGVITGVGAAVNAAQIKLGEDVVVIGAGGVGLNAVQGAKLAGARRVVAVDALEEKLQDARELGATDTIIADANAHKICQKILGRKADVVMVCVGSAAAYAQAPRYIGRMGRLVMLGMTHKGEKVPFEPTVIAGLGQKIIGSMMGNVLPSRDIPWMIDHYNQGRLQLDSLISKRWRFDQINEAIHHTRTGRARRNVISFDIEN